MNFRNLLTIGIISVLIAVGIIFIKPKSSSINLVGSSTLPLTGTFIVPDLFYSSASDYDRLLEEMQDAGINLVILSLTGQLRKNCTNGQYSEDKSSDRLNTHLINLINSATKYQMEIFFEVGNIEKSSCFPYYQGKANDESTDKGRIFAFTTRNLDAIQALLNNRSLIPTPPKIGGYYLQIEEDTRRLAFDNPEYPYLLFFKEISALIKSKTGQKVLFSPWQGEEANYDTSKQAFDNLYSKTSIDIISPQDSLGTGLTKTITASSTHFQALSDSVAKFPGKLAWANIETFGRPGEQNFTNYNPADIARIKQQIDAASKPNISKKISWMYTHTMMINPASDNMASKNQYATMYTPAKATARRALRDAYFTAYNATSKFNLASPVVVASPVSSPLSSPAAVSSTPKPSPTPSATPASPSNHKLGDLDRDGSVGLSDYNLLRRDFTKTGSPGFSPADLQADGSINLFDYNVLVQNYGK